MNKDKLVDWMFTYGWAILVILVAVGALFFFGVFKPTEKFNPELHNCVEQNECPPFKGFQGILNPDNFQLNAKHSKWRNKVNETFTFKNIGKYCYYPEIGADMSLSMALQNYEYNGKKWDGCVSWLPKKEEVVEEHSPLRNFTEAELHCLSSPEDEDKCECVEFSDNLLKRANETRLILPEGITKLPSGFSGGICGYGRGFNTSCTAWNFTTRKGCFIAIPNYCSSNPSDSEKCECVKTEALTKNVTEFKVDKWEIVNGCVNFVNGNNTVFRYNDTFRNGTVFASKGDALNVYNGFWGRSSSAMYPDIDFNNKEFIPNAVVCYTKALNASGKELNKTITVGQVCVEAVPK